MNKNSRIYVAGHNGMVGGALCRALKAQGYQRVITVDRSQVDLCNPMMVEWFFSSYIPEYVFLSAAKVGGIMANSTYPVEFMLDNMRIEMNVIENAKKYGVKKLLFLGSACAYPKLAANPILEDSLLTGALEPSNECYALAKISGIKLCEAYRKEYGCDFISAMPTNLYGIGDHYSLQDSHVIPGMIRRLHDAKEAGHGEAQLWGSGKPSREFLFSDDLAEACLMLMNHPGYLGLANIGYGSATRLDQLAEYVASAVGFSGDIFWDTTKPDGTPARQMDNSKIESIGFHPRTPLPTGLRIVYQDFLCKKTNPSAL
jgi:GDP-L-fucose synthase